MSGRRTDGMAAQAAAQASDAARVLQQRGQEAKEAAREAPAEQPQQRLTPPAQRPVEGEVTPPRRNSARKEAMAEIEERQRQTSDWKEVAFEAGPDGQKRAVIKEGEIPKVEDEAPAKPEAAPAAPAPVEAVEAAPETPAIATVKVKIDGEESEAPADEVEAAGGVTPYQMMKAAEKRLAEAKQTLAEAKKYQVDLGQLAQAIRTPQEPPKPKETDAQFIASKVDAIRFGTAEESAAALQEILTRANKTPDQAAMVEQAVSRMKHDQAVAQFDRDFADLIKDPLLLNWVLAERQRRLGEHQRAGQAVDWGNFYTTIGTEIRNRLGRQTQPSTVPAATQGTPSQKSEKEARKASIVPLPTAAARAEAPKEEKPQTREEVIAEMKKSRGLSAG